MTETERFIQRLIPAAAAVLDVGFSPDRCLNATRILMDVRRRAHVPAWAVSVTTLAINRAYNELVNQHGRLPASTAETEEWARCAGAHSIGLGFPERKAERGRWGGHLCIVVRGVLVDGSSGQLRRPQHGMHFPSLLRVGEVTDEFLVGEAVISRVLDDGSVAVYQRRMNGPSWDSAPGFQMSQHNLVAAREIATALGYC